MRRSSSQCPDNSGYRQPTYGSVALVEHLGAAGLSGCNASLLEVLPNKPLGKGRFDMKIISRFLLLALVGWSGGLMATSVSTHLMFQGAAHEAIELYTSVFDDFVVRKKELHDSGEMEGKVRLAHVKFANHDLIVFDSPPVHDFTFTPAMSLFVEFNDPAQLSEAFEVLSEGGEVAMPLDDYGFSPLFGWLQDRYGVSWQLSLTNQE